MGEVYNIRTIVISESVLNPDLLAFVVLLSSEVNWTHQQA